jgi:hypothetical protein
MHFLLTKRLTPRRLFARIELTKHFSNSSDLMIEGTPYCGEMLPQFANVWTLRLGNRLSVVRLGGVSERGGRTP